MTLTITDDAITSDVTGHTARRVDWRADLGWRMSWLPERLLTKNEAISGMTIAEHAGSGPRSLLDVLATELGLTGPEAARLAMAEVSTETSEANGASDEGSAYDDERAVLWGKAVRALTAAVRLDLDFGDFLGSALAAVAGNVGDTDRLIAGRPGSWEADLVMNLAGGTVGYDQDLTALARYRTEPVVVPLNVHDLLVDEANKFETPYEQEMYEIDERLSDIAESIADSDDGARRYEAALLEASTAEDAAKARWTAKYTAYAEAFAVAVAQEAAQIEGLQVPVTLRANASLDGARPDGLHDGDAENPDVGVDPLVLHLWQAARRAVPLPTRGTTVAPVVAPVKTVSPAETTTAGGFSHVTVAGFTVLINRSAPGREATS